MVNMNQTGEAAGVAAYLALHRSTTLKDVEAVGLRKEMQAGGSIVL
ncbi:hypothetical protein [Cohnella ginsengisoli]